MSGSAALKFILMPTVLALAAIGNLPVEAAIETPRIQAVAVSPNRVDAGANPATGTVTLSFAPAASVSVNLRSSNQQAAAVPSTVMVAKGQTQASFSVTIGKPSVTTNVSITAMLGSSMSGANLVVQVPLRPKVQTIYLSPASAAAGSKVLVMVKLNTLAPAGGQRVDLSYNPAALISGPAFAIVPERASATEVQVQAGMPVQQTAAEIKASINGLEEFKTALTIRGSAPVTPVRSFITPGRLRSQETGILTVELSSPAPSGGCNVGLASSDPGVMTVPSIINIPAGSITGRASVTVRPVQKSGTIRITASLNGNTAIAAVDIVGIR